MRCQLILLAVVAFLAGVHADTTTPQTDTRTNVGGSTVQTLTFFKFQGSLGTLTSVAVSISVTGATFTTKATNSDATASYQLSALTNAYAGTLTTKASSGGAVLNTVTVTASYTSPNMPKTLAPSSFYQESAQAATTIQSQQTTTVTTGLASYTGVGTTDPLTVSVTGTVTPSGTSDDTTLQVSYTGLATVSFGATLVYTYTPASVQGDPQIVGFQGQRFQIHGTPDEHYNLISSADYYINSKFVYMANGACTYNDTECFSHPGTYIGELALITGVNRVKIASGPHSTGLTAYINDKLAPVGTRVRFDNFTAVHVVSHSRVVLITPDLTMSAVNSDLFLNLGVDFTNAAVLHAGHTLVTIPGAASPAEADKLISTTYPEFDLHGLLGQTWRNIVWPHHRLYQGEPADYQVSTLFSPEFLYSQYQA